MLDFLLDNSIILISVILGIILGRSAYLKFLKDKNITSSEARSLIKSRLSDLGKDLVLTVCSAAAITVASSMLIYRELFRNDAFTTVVLALLLFGPVSSRLKKIFE